jgi:GTP pyrophosphokinase
VKDLPANATPVDFAYAVHTEVGNKCKSAKVNGKIVPLNHPLKNGEVIEIITGSTPQPNRYWLSFVITSHAKSSIKQWFNLQDREKLIRLGKELVNAQLQRYNQPILDPTLNLLKEIDGEKLTVFDRETLLEKIGNGSVSAVSIVKKILPDDAVMKPIGDSKLAQSSLNKVQIESLPEILITGEKGLKTSMATCCLPTTKDEIIGYITRGKGITIHKKDCKVLKGNAPERLVKASWSTQKAANYVVKLYIDRQPRIGLLRDVGAVFANNELPILNIEIPPDKPMVISSSVDNFETLNKVIDELEMIPGVNSVKEAS